MKMKGRLLWKISIELSRNIWHVYMAGRLER